MFELKLWIQRRVYKFRLRKNQETVSSQVHDKSASSVIIFGMLKLLLLCLFGAIILFPFVLMILMSFMSDSEIEAIRVQSRLLPSFGPGKSYVLGVGNQFIESWGDVVKNTYSRAAASGYFNALLLTVLNVVISIVLKIFVTFFMGYAFSLKNWRGKNLAWFIALSLLVLPEVALLSGQYIVVLRSGLTKTYLGFILAVAFPFTASIFNATMYKNAFETIPGRIKEVSLIDGAGGAKYLFKIAFPMVVPTTLTIVILTSLVSWNAYLWPSIIETIGGEKHQVLSVWLFNAGLDKDHPDAPRLENIRMAANIMSLLPMFVAFLIFRRRIMAAISRQGSTIKG
ncbi:carbohydrate ABC transporter permease [Mycoplasmopsis gallopavonis]|uniref:ABC-type maltose transport systems, permease component n=1 Tax=Mycoplasmopsis gallopavonis TaxID=76629 RepID=A0A449B0M3_9BACT|nr:carbohydrate ABC transporter permease [Mycoplasmopsis gallopavonis]RIV17009.1 carbohydrate ABC transporter permease [Mycoplasmopsis gallopavonis]VEU73286.1 ABC-type maltose transport systems, permease component [Mycoplasmopsis gallopavonis]